METEKDDKVKFIFLVKYAHGFDVFYFNFVIFYSFTRIIKSCFTGTEGVMAQCQWSNHDVWELTQLLQWRHNEHDGISNHLLLDCWLNRVFRHRSNKTSKLRVTGL